MKPEDGIVVKKDGNNVELETADDEMSHDEPDADNAGGMSDFDADNEDDDVMDMTGASDEEVLKVFKAMKPEDGIVVKKDGNNVEFGDGENEYIIKLDDMDSDVEMDEMYGMKSEEDMDEMKSEEDMDEMHKMDSDEETIYEIELDEEDEMEEDEMEETKKVEAKEAARTYGADVRIPANQGKKYKAGRFKSINEEVDTLKKQNAEYKKALVLFKDKLNEVAVFNANLAYATRLFTEHSTTKQEKLNILKRFDTVSTMNESKGLFNTIKTELGSKTTVTESVATKISNTPSTSSSTEVLSESKAYENPQFSRIKEMMRKIK
jgi:hypothetical protein